MSPNRDPDRSAKEIAKIRHAYEETAATVKEIMRRFRLEGSELYRLIEAGKWRMRGQGSVTKKLLAGAPKPVSPAARAAAHRAEDEARQQKLYGELLPDVRYLRRLMPVTREGGLYRVGNRLCSAAELREVANRERRLGHASAADSRVAIVRRGPAIAAPLVDAPKILPQPAAERVAGIVRGSNRKHPGNDLCRCGRADNHYGRCWARRGMAGPPSPSNARATA